MSYLSSGWPNQLVVLAALAAPALLPAPGALAQNAPKADAATTPPANVPSNGTWPINGAVNVPPGNLDNAGTITVGPGATLTIQGNSRGTAFSNWTGNGIISLDGGTLVLGQNASLNTTNRIQLKSGKISLSPGAQLRLRGTTTTEGGSVVVEPSAKLIVDGALYHSTANSSGEATTITNGGKFSVENGGNISLAQGAKLLSSGLVVVDSSTFSMGVNEPGDTTATTAEIKETFENSGSVLVKNGGVLHARGMIKNTHKDGTGGSIFLNHNGRLRVSGGVQVVPGRTGGAAIRKITGGVRGGYVNVDSFSHIEIPYVNSRVGSSSLPTHIWLDGTVHLEACSGTPGTDVPTDFRRRELHDVDASDGVTPDASLYSLTGSLTTGTGTFSVTVKQVGSDIKYGQMGIYGDFIINGGTLSVTKNPSNLNVVGINFDIIVADHIVRTSPAGSTAEPAFTSFSGAASTFDYRHVVPWPVPTPDPYLSVYRIKDSS